MTAAADNKLSLTTALLPSGLTGTSEKAYITLKMMQTHASECRISLHVKHKHTYRHTTFEQQ